MINLSLKKFLKLVFSFIGLIYLSVFTFSFITNFQSSSAYDLGSAVGFNIGFVTPYMILLSLIFIALFIINFGIKKYKAGESN